MADQESRRARWLKRLLRIGAPLVLIPTTLGLVFAGAVWLTLTMTVRVAEVEVPALIGLDEDQAQKRLLALKLRGETTGRRSDPFKPEGKVLEQIPAAGATTKPGRPIKLIVSSGPPRGAIPDLVGSSLHRATIALNKAKFLVGPTGEAWHPSVESGRVITQHPLPESEGFPGEGVSLLLSAGREAGYVMPNVMGRRVGQVRSALQSKGFGQVRISGSTADAARIQRQTPRPGHRVTRRDTIVLETENLGEGDVPPRELSFGVR